MRRMSKRAWKGVKQFVDLTRSEFEKRGIVLNEVSAFEPSLPESHFSYEGEAMTDHGHVAISLHDFLHLRFAIPDGVSSILPRNSFTGKCNFHHDREGFGNAEYTVDFVDDIMRRLDTISIRPWEITYRRLSSQEFAEKSIAEWRKAEHMGFSLSVEGLNRQSIIQDIIGTCDHSNDPALTEHFARSLEKMSDIRLMDMWDRHVKPARNISNESVALPKLIESLGR